MPSFFRTASGKYRCNRRHRATLHGKHCVTQQPPSTNMNRTKLLAIRISGPVDVTPLDANFHKGLGGASPWLQLCAERDPSEYVRSQEPSPGSVVARSVLNGTLQACFLASTSRVRSSPGWGPRQGHAFLLSLFARKPGSDASHFLISTAQAG
jgi:hypothetical protein